MMNVVIDYGNTSAKVGIFDTHQLIAKHVFATEVELKKFLENFSADHLIISSVTVDPQHISDWATRVKKKVMLHHSLPLPIQNLYATPTTLGVDRIAAVCGAQQMFPSKHCLTIDAGTCVTYDFLDAKGAYHGGGISPGLNMRFDAMHAFTARLPQVTVVESVPLIGNTSVQCMQSGVVYGLVEEIDGVIRRYTEEFKELQVILCGGDARFFENKLKASIFAVPELVLSGLNSILIYNVNR
jgi:type III pantothenate kinase